ncbi:MAG: methyltransferase domain-containing protein [Berryella intestinalis]|uniref:class I SAM-dependent methyltransferase n=1 Tax=Berryella intestinalis TaxID=1531429 RepID=UPI002A54EB0F|nr:methyltransferase domain-containing protein [Berryella intestinalis]MDD7369683.1 methyltransferase domain-containing protein [Berryella intestinalis]MDY3129473.1 methyltransferase domain-containing protein [Berryella intestinalis]
MTDQPRSLLTTTDWNGEWRALQKSRAKASDAKAWDERAATFPTAHGSQSGYVERFLDLAGIREGETVFDMGCGTGALAIPLVEAGHPVVAADFSAGMLGVMMKDLGRIAEPGEGSLGSDVRVMKMSWEDDWDRFGVKPRSADVAVASRSIATSDLEDALMKLDAVARRRVCITLPCASSPRIDRAFIDAVGLGRGLGRDFLYAFNILAARGIRPEVAYIPSKRYDTFETIDEARRLFGAMIESAAREDDDTSVERAFDLLEPWLSENIVPNDRDGEKPLRTKNPRNVTWAFISWNK